MAIQKVKEYAEQGYTQAVLVDLSKYFDTLNHELLMNLLRKNIHDKRVIELIKRYLKAGVMGSSATLLIEKGQPVQKRSCPKGATGRCVGCKPYCHITTGFSGAGAFSDGNSICG